MTDWRLCRLGRPLVSWLLFGLVSLPTFAASQTLTPTPVGTPSRIEVKPLVKTISVGEFANYTITAIFGDRSPKKYTQKVEYTSSDPTIAEATNTEGNRERLDAVSPGVTTITAAEPATPLSANATLTLQGAVALILEPREKSVQAGDVVIHTTTGTLSDGITKTMTLKIEDPSSDTFVWENVLAPAIGMLFSVALAWFTPMVMNTVKSKAKPAAAISDADKPRWELWLQATKNQHSVGSGRLLGELETVLFFYGLWCSKEIVVGAWLAFKIAAKWEAWNHVVSPAKGDPFAKDELRNLWARHQWGVRLLRRFLIGTLFNLLSAAAGVLMAQMLSHMN